MTGEEHVPFDKNTTETEKWVRALYRGLLQREPDAEGMKLWMLAIKSGRAPSAVVRAFVESDEFNRARSKRGMFANENKNILIASKSLPLNEPYTTIISGVQRGGTSMVAGVLGELGVDLGPVALNHEDPNFVLMSGHELQAYVNKRNQEAQRWGFKLPGAHVDTRFNEVKFRNPIWIFVFRNALSNLDSILARSPNPSVENLLAGYRRIIEYYEGIHRIISNRVSNYLLISYERAAAAPDRFAKELVQALGLQRDASRFQRATKQVTGDGGGYLPASRYYHRLEVSPAFTARNGTLLIRSREIFETSVKKKPEIIAVQDKEVSKLQDYIVKYPGKRKRPVTVILDFGEGFTGLASYDLPMSAEDILVRVLHDGAVRRIGFYARGSQLPSDVTVLRCHD